MINLDKLIPIKPSIGILLLRIFIGCRLLYGVVDNIISWERMIEFSQFLAAHHFPMPIVSAIVSVYVQGIGAILIILGLKTRIASLVLVINFLIALIFVHVVSGDSIEGMTPALAMLFGCLTLLFTGPGEISLKSYWSKKSRQS